jgi:hypothetical protein
MNKPAQLTRRKTVAILCGGGAALGLGVAAWRLQARSRRSSLLPDFRMELDALRYIAEKYLEDYPAERDVKVLENALLDSLSRSGASDDPQRAVKEAVSRDFEQGDTVSLDGWHLSRTEVRLWVLCAGPAVA